MTVTTKLEIAGTQYDDALNIKVRSTMSETNGVSFFEIDFDNVAGRHADDFSLNDAVAIYADSDGTNPAVTKIFTGVIEDKRFAGRGTRQRLILSGRDNAVKMKDVIAAPRIFKDTEVSEIVESLLVQNLPGAYTYNNINSTATTLDKITFNNVSVFDAIRKLAALAGFIFYVDKDEDFHFEQRDSVASGETFSTSNVTEAIFTEDDAEIYNNVTVYGARQLTGATEVFAPQAGSLYVLDAKPHNVGVVVSGATNLQLQPGGVFNISQPASEDVEFLVDFNSQAIVITSGTTAGDNTTATGSPLIITYDQDTPLIKRLKDQASVDSYSQKDKTVVDRNIRDLGEATDFATAFLTDNKDPKVEGRLDVKGVLDVVVGQTAIVNLPDFEQSGVAYGVTEKTYEFNPTNNQAFRVMSVKMNQRTPNILDTMKEQILRLRALEGAEIETSITNLFDNTGSFGVSGTASFITKSIGSGFWFNIPGHDQLNSPSSLLGPYVGGSTVLSF